MEGFEREMLKIVSYGATSEQWAGWLTTPLKYASMGGNLELADRLRVASGTGGSEGGKESRRHPYPRRAARQLQWLETEIFRVVSSGGTPDEWADWLRVPLEHAAARGDPGLVDALLEGGANGGAGWRGCGGRTLLDAAAVGGNADVVSALVSAGGTELDVNVVSVSSGRSALYTATHYGHEACARRLIEAGADMNFQDPVDRWSVLHRAVEGGLEQLVNDLLVGGVDADTRQDGGCTAVHVAAYAGQNGSLSALLLRGADKDAVDDSGSTPLVRAAMKGHLPVANTLLAAGADCNVRNTDAGGTALYYAAYKGHDDVLSALLLGGADTDARTNDGHTPLMLAAYHGFVFAVDALLAAGANVNAVGNAGNASLIIAAFRGRLPVVEALLAANADVNTRSVTTGRAALHFAAEKGYGGIVCALLQKGADKDACASNGTTPMWTAAAKGHVSVVETLLEAGANANIANRLDGTFSLHLVAGGGYHEAVLSLLRREADVDALDNQGMSPLAWAARGGHVVVVEALLAAGADPDTRSTDILYSALDWAVTRGNIQVVEALIRRGAGVDACSSVGETALHKAARNDRADAVEALIKAGAHLELKTDQGLTPLLVASRCITFDTTIALLEHGAAVSVQDKTGETPLHRVCRCQHQGLGTVIDLLLLRGADEGLSNNQGHTPSDLLDVNTTWPIRKCSEEEMEGARMLLSRASANRAWGRRCWVVMLRSRARDPARGIGGDKKGGGAEELDKVLSGAVSMLLRLASEDLFRTTVGFL